MRIIAGEFKGRRLDFIKTPGVRPAMDRVKESLFNVLGDTLADKNVLDLFAGSGSIGLEAISRGAKKCVFVDNDQKNASIMKQNSKKLGISEDRAAVFCCDWKAALRKLKGQKEAFDFVFVDPPYKRKDIYQNVLLVLSSSGILQNEAVIVIEHETRDKIPSEDLSCKLLRSLKFGGTSLSCYRYNHEEK